MGTIFDYLDWRGDIPFAQVPLNPVDALILSTLAYVHFQDLVPSGPVPACLWPRPPRLFSPFRNLLRRIGYGVTTTASSSVP